MIVVEIPNYSCPKCYDDLIFKIEITNHQVDLDKDMLIITHFPNETCEDRNLNLKVPIKNFLVSIFHE